MGSVKDLNIIIKPTENMLGEGVFTFSNRYSVFDWGEMPDHIPGKGGCISHLQMPCLTEEFLMHQQLKKLRKNILNIWRG